MKYIKNNTISNKTWLGTVVAAGSYYSIEDGEVLQWASDSVLLTDIGSGDAIVAKSDDGLTDISDVNEAINYLKDIQKVRPETKDEREIVSIMRMPAGYTVYPTGISDNITNGTYGNGERIMMDGTDTDSKVAKFQMLHHFYAIGGRIIWEGADMDDYINAFLCAPKTVGLNQAGDFNKVEVAPSSGMHIYVPTAAGTGAWDLDIAEKKTNTDILACTPVPSPGNTGFFDYDSTTNTLTVNATQTGGYNLCDWDVDLFSFTRGVPGKKQDGAESSLEVPDVEGKLLFNCWVIKFELITSKGATCKAAGVMILAAKKNI